MSNKYIELVKKWLADPESVSKEELEANSSEALAADLAAWTATASVATARAARAAASASCAAVYASTDRAEYWIKKYEELTK